MLCLRRASFMCLTLDCGVLIINTLTQSVIIDNTVLAAACNAIMCSCLFSWSSVGLCSSFVIRRCFFYPRICSRVLRADSSASLALVIRSMHVANETLQQLDQLVQGVADCSRVSPCPAATYSHLPLVSVKASFSPASFNHTGSGAWPSLAS